MAYKGRNWKPYEDALLRAFVDNWKRENPTTSGNARKTLNKKHWIEISEALKEAGVDRTPKACASRMGRNGSGFVAPKPCQNCEKEPVVISRHYDTAPFGAPERDVMRLETCSEDCMEEILSSHEGEGHRFTQVRRVVRGGKLIGYARQPNPKKRPPSLSHIKHLEAIRSNGMQLSPQAEQRLASDPVILGGLFRQSDLKDLPLGSQYIIEMVDETKSGEKLFKVRGMK